MRQLTRFGAFVATTLIATTSAAVLTLGTPTAAADGTEMVPLSPILRRCDWSNDTHTPSDVRGTAYVLISHTGSTVNAEVHMLAVTADIWYGIRLVQVPRPGIGCGPGDPGVGVGRLYTDGVGNGTATVQAPLMDGATGAWVSVEGPTAAFDQLAGDFRTSDYLAPI